MTTGTPAFPTPGATVGRDALAPFTGVGRADWERVADHLLEAVGAYASTDLATYDLPGRRSSAGPRADGLEGFARTFLLAAYRIRGARGEGMAALVERYARGLLAGVRSGRWLEHRNYGTSIVEAASIALALHETRPWLWEQLEIAERRTVAAWLAGVNGCRVPINNWLLFPVIVNEFLRAVEQPHSSETIVGNLDLIDAMYAGDGWYADGFGANFDHYCGWAMAFYTAMWSLIGEDRDRDPRRARYLDRLGLFVDQYQHLFGGDGSPVHIGRSLTYRWAVCAPLWLAARTGRSAVAPATVRRIASACLRHFIGRGAIDPATGLLTAGWHGRSEVVLQSWSGPASPYWVAKGFAGLALDPRHPAWAERERPAPIDRGDFTLALRAPGWLAHGTRDDGIVRVYNHGSDHYPWPDGPRSSPHYRKLGYSTATGPEVTEADDSDSQVAFVARDGRVGRRERFEATRVEGPFASSRCYPLQFARGRAQRIALSAGMRRSFGVTLPPGIWVTRRPLRAGFRRSWPSWDPRLDVLSLARLGVEARVVRCVTAAGGEVVIGGFAVADERAPAGASEPARAWAEVPSGLRTTAFALSEPCRCALSRRHATNAFGTESAAPVLRFEVPAGETIVAAVIALGAGAAAHQRCPVTACVVEERRVTLTWSDRTQDRCEFAHGSWALEHAS